MKRMLYFLMKPDENTVMKRMPYFLMKPDENTKMLMKTLL
jgi:hypothetical protein